MPTLREKVLAAQYSVPGTILGFFGPHRFLSNFHMGTVCYEGDLYPSSENAFQAAKVERKDRSPFFTCTPGEAKKLGRTVKMRLSLSEWDAAKVSVMKEILMDKFNTPHIREALLATYPNHLVESNWWGDKFWGVCEGEGCNHLGLVIEEVREFLYGTYGTQNG